MNPFYKSTFVLGLITLASRILGLARDMVIAGMFGVSVQAGLFFLVFRPFDLLRKLLSDGIMGMFLVPVLTQKIHAKETDTAAGIVISAICWVALIGVFLIGAGCLAAPMLMKLAGPKLSENPQTLKLGIDLLRILLPYAVCMGFSCIFMATLHSANHFYIPGAGPAIFNGVIILTTILFDRFLNIGIFAVAAGVVLGGLVQACMQLPWVIPKLTSWRMSALKSVDLQNPHLASAVKKFLPCVTGSAAYQINILIAAVFASFLNLENVSFLYFADRLIQFPLALIGSTCATVLLPKMATKIHQINISQKSSNAQPNAFEHHFFFLCLLGFSAAAGLFAIKKPLVFLLFCHGSFGVKAASQTADCLAFLSLGLWAYIGNRILASLYQGMGITKLPFYAAILSFISNIVLGLLCWQSLGIRGIALGVSISSIMGFSILFFSHQNPWEFVGRQVLVSTCRAIFISAIMGLFIHGSACSLMGMNLGRTGLCAGLFACVIAGILITMAGTLCLAPKHALFLLTQKGERIRSHEHS